MESRVSSETEYDILVISNREIKLDSNMDLIRQLYGCCWGYKYYGYGK